MQSRRWAAGAQVCPQGGPLPRSGARTARTWRASCPAPARKPRFVGRPHRGNRASNLLLPLLLQLLLIRPAPSSCCCCCVLLFSGCEAPHQILLHSQRRSDGHREQRPQGVLPDLGSGPARSHEFERQQLGRDARRGQDSGAGVKSRQEKAVGGRAAAEAAPEAGPPQAAPSPQIAVN
jgi:hypothetical protein